MTLGEMTRKICMGRDCRDCPLFKFDCRDLSINNADEKTAAALTRIYNSLFNPTALSESSEDDISELSEDDVLNIIAGE